MPETALDRFFELERRKYGKAKYYFKGDKLSAKTRAFYMRPLCPRYTRDFSTTLYPNTFFASKKKGKLQSCLETEYHENVHKWDRWNQGFKFVLKYAWPHWMGLPFLIAAVALSGLWGWAALVAFVALVHIGLAVLAVSAGAGEGGRASEGASVAFYVLSGAGLCLFLAATIVGGGFWALLWVGALLFFSPWPFTPIWRRDYEIRGYTMSLYRIWLKHRKDFDRKKWRAAVEKYADIFAGPEYFFMETDKFRVRKEFFFQTGRLQFSEAEFLKSWVWRGKLDSPLPRDAEPFRMVKFFINQENSGG